MTRAEELRKEIAEAESFLDAHPEAMLSVPVRKRITALYEERDDLEKGE